MLRKTKGSSRVNSGGCYPVPEGIVPNFYIAGAPKSGTTAWAKYLGTHPDVTFGHEKEPHFFNHDIRWLRDTTPEQYAAAYAGCKDYLVVGDASVLYIFSEAAPTAIAAASPNSKVILFLREHVGFVRSYHSHLCFLGIEDVESLTDAWGLSGARSSGKEVPAGCPDGRLLDYRSIGHFAGRVESYLAAFGSARLMVLWMEDWVHDSRRTYLEILEFLGIKDDGRVDFPRVNSAPFHRSRIVRFLLNGGKRPILLATAPLRGLMRSALGGRKLGLYQRVREINTRRGTVPMISAALQAEIEAEFAGDREAVTKLLDR